MGCLQAVCSVSSQAYTQSENDLTAQVTSFSWKYVGVGKISVVTDSKSTAESADFSWFYPNLNPRIFSVCKWQFWFVCLRISIYLSGSGVQATLLNTAAAGHHHRLIGGRCPIVNEAGTWFSSGDTVCLHGFMKNLFKKQSAKFVQNLSSFTKVMAKHILLCFLCPTVYNTVPLERCVYGTVPIWLLCF